MTDSIATQISQAKVRAFKEGPAAYLTTAVCWIWSREVALRSDCSGFARAVAKFLDIQLSGMADDIYAEMMKANRWRILGVGDSAAKLAGSKAAMGNFVLAATPSSIARKSADGTLHGHIALVLGTRQLLEVKQGTRATKLAFVEAGRPVGVWGQYGAKNPQTLNAQGDKDKHTEHAGQFLQPLSGAFSKSQVGTDGLDHRVSNVSESRYGQVLYAHQAIPAPEGA